MNRIKRVSLMSLFFALCFAFVLAIDPAQADRRLNEESWKDLKSELFGQSEILDGASMMAMEAPVRAHDAAVVPIKISTKSGVDFVKVTLLIDENPVPLAGVFTFGPAAANASFSTRIRVNSYSYVRAIGEARDGKLYMVKKYVKASGGCAAPASKDMDKAIAQMGKMKLRLFSGKAKTETVEQSGPRPAQLMIRHPNYSGFQMDQITMLYIPAHFVDSIEVTYDNQLVMKVEAAISLSEDPNIRFFYKYNGAGEISVRATDNEQKKFVGAWPVTGS